MDNIFVTLADLPGSIRSFVVRNRDMTYTIVLNSKLNHDQHLICYNHEIDHIRNGDYEKKYTADLIEIAAHRI